MFIMKSPRVINYKMRYFFLLHIYQFRKPYKFESKANTTRYFLSIGLFWLPVLDFRIGTYSNPFWIRCENLYAWKCKDKRLSSDNSNNKRNETSNHIRSNRRG